MRNSRHFWVPLTLLNSFKNMLEIFKMIRSCWVPIFFLSPKAFSIWTKTFFPNTLTTVSRLRLNQPEESKRPNRPQLLDKYRYSVFVMKLKIQKYHISLRINCESFLVILWKLLVQMSSLFVLHLHYCPVSVLPMITFSYLMKTSSFIIYPFFFSKNGLSTNSFFLLV